ncbi:DUF533 domain-containing protein [Nereida sp. MMG025]|uniref:DUF533 domain-containing protein n=1 Tax=Nereida sp. MMG025 TaxID=2909981 RepID=UPI001F2E8D02|nr:DUF533 domain-containing protein [Nereida sp. MMG025]MCF6443460.1 tellurite resistance TerB family protein [Nereida sp. MMG025]
MGLMGTLAKVAIGYAASQAVNKASGGEGLGGLLGQLQQGGQMAAGNAQAGGNALQDMMGQMMGGAQDAAQSGAGGLQDMLGGLMGGAQGGQAGGLQDMLGGMMGGGTDGQQGGGMQDMLGSLTGGGAGLAGLLAAAGGMAAATGGGGALAGMLDQMGAAQPDADQKAELMLRAMIQAAKADGQIDATEQERILGSLGDDADAEEIAFVKAQLAAPIDVQGLAASATDAQKPEVYAMSLMAIKVDTQGEAQYLNDLAQAMGLDQQQVNMIHNQMGVQPLYS